jgi:hypothetical protein
MKSIIPALMLAAPAVAVAIDSPLDFSTAKIEVPTLSLAESAQQAVPSLVQDFRPMAKVNVVSRMPIIVPSAELDPKMVKAPDPSIGDASMVKTPDVQSAH